MTAEQPGDSQRCGSTIPSLEKPSDGWPRHWCEARRLVLLRRLLRQCALVTLLPVLLSAVLPAQSVCLPLPRLLTTMPMGGTVGSHVEITITGEHIDGAGSLYFSHPGLTASPVLNALGQPEPNRYLINIAPDCPPGIYEARLMTRLGISSSRIFSVDTLPELTCTEPNTSLSAAMELPVNSVCNAVMSQKSVDFYAFDAQQGHRYVVSCAARGIDSKLEAVLIIADAEGRDLMVERSGDVLDFTAPSDGRFVIKVHELTFRGGPAFFYRLSLRELSQDAAVPQLASTRAVNAYSWPPAGLTETAPLQEAEPNDTHAQAQRISLPCDLSGSFYPAADVDTFEFMATKGDVWWVELASERLGRPTDPSVVVQHVRVQDAEEVLTDVAEFTDIPSPIRPSSNGYAYDGPPFDGGSSDLIGRLEIQNDGLHRLQLTDLFGGTRNDRRNQYRLIIRRAAPDFALAAWGLHMELRNGDRNAVSKPLALRAGVTVALEVAAFRRDGFDGDIELVMDGLPDGVRAQGLKIPAGRSRGIMLITADQNAPPALADVTFYGRSVIGDEVVTRPCQMAAMAWPVPDAWNEIPAPRLVSGLAVSVTNSEYAPISIAAGEQKIFEATAGEKLTIPLIHTRRSEFSGDTLQLRTWGYGFEQVPQFNVSLSEDISQVVLDLAALNTAPGDYLIAFYGSAVAKYRYNPEAVTAAESRHQNAGAALEAIASELQKLNEQQAADQSETNGNERQTETERVRADLNAQHAAAQEALTSAAAALKAAADQAAPRDTVDIVLSEPVTIRVVPAEAK